MSLEAYLTYFKILAEAQGWAVQLASSLKGPAMEVLSQLDTAQRTSYPSRPCWRVGTATTTKLKCSGLGSGPESELRERLCSSSPDLEHLVRKAYPGASEELTVVLLRDQFVDALEDPQLKIYVKQAH